MSNKTVIISKQYKNQTITEIISAVTCWKSAPLCCHPVVNCEHDTSVYNTGIKPESF